VRARPYGALRMRTVATTGVLALGAISIAHADEPARAPITSPVAAASEQLAQRAPRSLPALLGGNSLLHGIDAHTVALGVSYAL